MSQPKDNPIARFSYKSWSIFESCSFRGPFKDTVDKEHVRDGQRCQTDEDDLQQRRLDADAGRLLSQHHQTERPGEQGKHHRGLGDAET